MRLNAIMDTQAKGIVKM